MDLSHPDCVSDPVYARELVERALAAAAHCRAPFNALRLCRDAGEDCLAQSRAYLDCFLSPPS